MTIKVVSSLICTIIMTFSVSSQAQVSRAAVGDPSPQAPMVYHSAESDTLLDILTLGAILVGSSSAAAILGAAIGAAATQSLCPSFGCSSSQERAQNQIDPVFPLGGALMGGALAGAFGAYIAGAVTTLFFTADGSSGE